MSDSAEYESSRPTWVALRIALIYLTLSVLWIYFSDRLLIFLVDDPARLTRLQTAKGWLFVSVSGLLIYFLVRRALYQAHAAQVQIRQLNQELELRIAERTAQLQAANRELKAFSYSVSHDLKAPLRGIDGYSRLLEEEFHERLNAEGRGFLRNIRQGASRMQQLIEDLLSYAHMEQRTLQRTSVDLNLFLREVSADCEAELKRRGGELRIEVPALRVRADHEGLHIVLRNLLENSLKFSHGIQAPCIEIGGRLEGDKAILWVRDNGIGFEEKFRERIFDIFQRLHLTEDYSGTGIGLALVRRAMQRMGGRVWAEGASGAGAVFYLELPAVLKDEY
ncbi:His Kinase A (phospho-acceptor) domain-containing protein [Geoalkalibacter ferrihydriticus]|uniref:histidine kinase n=1 Tax=Geoalkalibacter ferrihydriticus TaxID=392333 RepID=A0A1G9WZH6_9BACT|nr:ATP-binding protein [Geoalkalibacter ferrihydriticus]SDM89515.1 His Kinase A (phospho-acceptor) domain-containing protein [Geoalkalibacter ferrihydriticus]